MIHQDRIVEALRNGPLTASEIGAACGIPAPHLSSNLAAMEQQGMVTFRGIYPRWSLVFERATWPPLDGGMKRHEVDAIRRAMVNRETA